MKPSTLLLWTSIIKAHKEKKLETIQRKLFPSTLLPWQSSILATIYISTLPNFVLLLIPKDLKHSTLNLMVSYAVGGLLGDVFLHLIPHSFHPHEHKMDDAPNGEKGTSEIYQKDVVSEVNGNEVTKTTKIVPTEEVENESTEDYEGSKKSTSTHSHGHGKYEEKVRNLLIGLAIFIGFLTFFLMDKLMRLYSGSHSHSHKKIEAVLEFEDDLNGSLSSSSTGKKPKRRTTKNSNKNLLKESSTDLSAYLSLLADISHNFTDGLALSASFYTSPQLGFSTFLAVLIHEVPHEIGDFAILIQQGFTNYQALASQFITALGALVGTLIGIAIEELGSLEGKNGFFKCQFLDSIIKPNELIIPFISGSFLYVSTSMVIPSLLEKPKDLKRNGKKLLVQLILELMFMLIGVSVMAFVAYYE